MSRMNWNLGLPVVAFGLLSSLLIWGCGGGGTGTGGNDGGGNGGGTGTRVRGTIRDDFGTGLDGIQIRFFDAGGSVVGTATSSAGNYQINVSGIPVRMNLVSTSISNVAFYRIFNYRSGWYQASGTCNPTIPNVIADQLTNMGNVEVPLRSSPPPPPPSPCP
jgi:hypothetical protein